MNINGKAKIFKNMDKNIVLRSHRIMGDSFNDISYLGKLPNQPLLSRTQ